MNIKKSMIAGVMTLLVVFTFTTAAWAGSAHHHRMEGLAWGIGAAILGKVILDHHRNTYPQPAPAPATRGDPKPLPPASVRNGRPLGGSTGMGAPPA